MKKNKNYLILPVIALAGLSLLTTQCKKDTETVTVHDTTYVNVHDTAYGKSISGTATYQDYSGVSTPAKGAVINLYLGTSATGIIVASAFADAAGNYVLPYLLPNTYFVYAKYNTENTNVKTISGINFATNPGYTVVMSNSNVTQNLSLVSYVATGTLKISLDTTVNQFRKVTWEIHSKCDFTFPDHVTGAELPGGFNVFQVDRFAFDVANPANSLISGYVLLSTVNTFEPARDELAAGCVRKTLNVDTLNATTPLPETDTARFTSTSIVKYGDGYLAHGNLTAFYKSDGLTPGYGIDSANGYAGPYNQMITKPCDLYFVYQGKTLYPSGANYKWSFIFEGEFRIKPLTDYYINSSHFGTGDIKVNCHVQFLGAQNTDYPD